MKRIAIFTLVALTMVQACSDDRAARLAVSAKAEKVSLVLYYTDGPFDYKKIGETVLLNTAETVTVPRRVIRPDEKLITGEWNDVFLPAMNAAPRPGSVELLLDREQGVICNGSRCADVLAICPPMPAMKRGAKCRTYAKK